MSQYPNQYPFDEQPPRKGSNVWFYIVLVLVAAVVGGLFVQYMLPALRQPGADPQMSVSPTPTPGIETTAATTTAAETTTTQTEIAPETTTAQLNGQLVNSNAVVDEDAGLPDVVEAVGPAVVGISNRAEMASMNGIIGSINGIPIPGDSESTEEMEQGYGSGVIISTDGYIVTNAHVVDSASKLVVILAGGEEVEATLVGSDETTDLALLKIEKEGLTAIKLGDSDAARVAETVLAIGNPLGQEFYGSVSKGIISATNRPLEMDGHVFTMIQTDTAINSGNSGGALINTRGELIGICSSKMISSGYDAYGNNISAEGMGFAIPINDAMTIISELKEKGYIERPAMGVSGAFLTEQGAAYYHCPVGFLVYDVSAQSGAAEAGIHQMDIITAIDGKELTTYNEMSETITSHEVGDVIRITVWRDGETLELDVTLSASSRLNQTEQETTPARKSGY